MPKTITISIIITRTITVLASHKLTITNEKNKMY